MNASMPLCAAAIFVVWMREHIEIRADFGYTSFINNLRALAGPRAFH